MNQRRALKTISTPDLRVTWASPSFYSFFGVSPADIIGLPIFSMPSIDPSHREQVRIKLQAVIDNRAGLVSIEPAIRHIEGCEIRCTVKWLDKPIIESGLVVSIHSIGYPS